MKDKRMEIAINILMELASLEKFEDVIQTLNSVTVCACINQEDVTSDKVRWLEFVIDFLKHCIQKIQKGEI